MEIKTQKNREITKSGNTDIVTWEPKYSVGVPLIDSQHRELVNLTNVLYKACLSRDKSIGTVFSDAMHKMVDYVRFHFNAENKLLETIKFPEHSEHKKLHETLVKEILAAVKSYEEGNKLVPNTFVRTLKEWVFGHIAICDQVYALYIVNQKKKGLLTDAEMK